MIKKLSSVLAISSLMALPVSQVLAADSPWYAQLEYGSSKVAASKTGLDNLVTAALSSVGTPVVSGASTLDDSDTSFALSLGYQLNSNFAFEFGYTDLGKLAYDATGRVNIPALFVVNVPATVKVGFKSDGFTIAGTGTLPLNDKFDVHAKLGVLFAKTTLDGSVSYGGATPGTFSTSASSQEAFYGLGAGMKLTDNFGLALDWARYAAVGDKNKTDEGDVDRLGLSAKLSF